MGQNFTNLLLYHNEYLNQFARPLTQDKTFVELDNKNGPVHEMVATVEEMDRARLRFEHRDYCAHLYMKYEQCLRDKKPWIAQCKHEAGEWQDCQYWEEVHRHKKMERAKRILKRRKERDAAMAT